LNNVPARPPLSVPQPTDALDATCRSPTVTGLDDQEATSIVLQDAASPETPVPAAPPPSNPATRSTLQRIGGSARQDFNSVMFREVLGAVFVSGDNPESVSRWGAAVSAGLMAFKPRDEIEGMLAAQAVAMHFSAMECMRRAIIPEQPGEVASKLRKDGANMARGMVDMLDALERKRGKRPQVVRVERVIVESGGQAIVGIAQTGQREEEQ
jgi:hypothetical protein